MSFFSKEIRGGAIVRLKASKPQPLLSPHEAPMTITVFMPDFHDYRYAGLALGKVVHSDALGERSYRRALAVRMVREEGTTPDEPHVRMDMVVTLRDLWNGNHPQAQEITGIVTDYYNKNVYGAEIAAAKIKPVLEKRGGMRRAVAGLAFLNKLHLFGV